MHERPLVYLACPYSHPERAVRVARFEAANAAAGGLMRDGVKVFSPISHTHPIAEAGGLPLGFDFWEAFDRAYISYSHRIVVLRVDGWRESRGVQAELRMAVEQGIHVEYIDPGSEARRPAAGPSEEVSVLERVTRERDEARARIVGLEGAIRYALDVLCLGDPCPSSTHQRMFDALRPLPEKQTEGK